MAEPSEAFYAQPPREGMVFVDVVFGPEGPCLTLGDHEASQRLAGPKPWGGGVIRHRFAVRVDELKRVLAEYDAQCTTSEGEHG